MKIEKLTENKLRIILDIDEMAKKNIDLISLTKNPEIAQKLFKKILKQAEKEVDFYVEDSKLLIEAFVSSEGFFVVTFTKLVAKESSCIEKSAKLRAKRKLPNSSCGISIYQFNTFDEFCAFCTYLNNSKLKDTHTLAKNIVLYEYMSKYFLVCSKINSDFEKLPIFYTCISEFAKHISDSFVFNSKLIEYRKNYI